MMTLWAGIAIYATATTLLIGSFYLLFLWACRSRFVATCIDYSGVVTILVPPLVLAWWMLSMVEASKGPVVLMPAAPPIQHPL
jgi:hypothetical protein